MLGGLISNFLLVFAIQSTPIDAIDISQVWAAK